MTARTVIAIVVCVLPSAIEADEAAELPKNAKEVTKLLEKRWSLDAIKKFCVPKRRFDPLLQNLVLDGEVRWKGALYEKKETTFDEITWYANIDGDRLSYSLNVRNGKDRWNLEIGNAETMREPLKQSFGD